MGHRDYSKSIIYKICCNNASITDEYIGSTTNKSHRKANHKLNVINNKRKDYNSPLYECIRNNGDWDNWTFLVLEEYKCENEIELRIRERYWIELRKPTLNKQIPNRTQKEYDNTNKDKIKKYRQQYYINNKEYIIKRNCEQQKKKVICECGIEICKSSMSRHRNSILHNSLNF